MGWDKLRKAKTSQGGRSIAAAADHPWPPEEPQSEAVVPVQFDDAGGCLVGQHHRSQMTCQPLGEADLILPCEPGAGVLGELYIISGSA